MQLNFDQLACCHRLHVCEERQRVTHAWWAGEDEHLAAVHASVPHMHVMESFT